MNKYNPMRNFNKWMEKIMCRDDNVPPEILSRILGKFQKDYKGFKRGAFDIPIDQIRKCLKQLGLSKYNTRIAFIKQYLTLQDPPQFSEAEIRRMAECYGKIIHTYYHISKNYNIPYCPHIIMMIVKNCFPNDTEKHRIKDFIHFQNHGTTWKFDAVWKQICSKLDGFVYESLTSAADI